MITLLTPNGHGPSMPRLSDVFWGAASSVFGLPVGMQAWDSSFFETPGAPSAFTACMHFFLSFPGGLSAWT